MASDGEPSAMGAFRHPDIDQVPSVLKVIPNWVAWRLDPPRGKNPKPTKVPINPKTGRRASVSDAATWWTFERAIQEMRESSLAGIGLVLTVALELVVIDLDHCIDSKTGEIQDWAEKLVERFASYTEFSPSGTGLHIWIRGKLPSGHNRKGDFEVYDGDRYMTVTGRPFDDRFISIEERTKVMAEVFAEVFCEPASNPQPARSRKVGPQDLDDAALLMKASSAKNGDKFDRLYGGDPSDYPSQSEAELALCGQLAFWCGPDPARIDRMIRGSGLIRPKWDERRGESTYGERTIAKALKHKTKFYDPTKARERARELMPRSTDSSNAELFVELAKGDLRYCAAMKAWFHWNQRAWERDALGAALRQGKAVIRELGKRMLKIKDPRIRLTAVKWVRTSAGAERRKAMPALAGAEAACAIRADAFDADPWLLNLQNGTLDLRTFNLGPHRREAFITKISPAKFDPEAMAPRWRRFLEQVLPNEEDRRFFQRWTGLCLTGDQGDQKFLFLHGDGANGKSTALRVLQGMLGFQYAINASSELLTQRRERGHPTEYADLAGIRLAICTEMNQGEQLDESLVKRLTGGERIRARRMREDFWEFDPTHHIVIATNHLPNIRGRDHAIWRRLLILRFDVTIKAEDQDPGLTERILNEERAGVLQWALVGLADWTAHGNRLDPPPSVIAQAQHYRRETDFVARFVDEACERVPNARVGASEFYKCYEAWCQSQGAMAEPQRSFGQSMRVLGIETIKSSGVIQYRDIRPSCNPDPEKAAEGGSGTYSRMNSEESEAAYGDHPGDGPRSSPNPHEGAAEGVGRPSAARAYGHSRPARSRLVHGGAGALSDDIDDHGHRRGGVA